MAVISISDLSFSYPATNKAALNSISLHIGQGEFIGLIGANNSGKSTLCHSLTGVIPHLYHGQREGRVLILGKDTAEMSVAEISASVAFVMQNPKNQLSGICFTVREEIAFNLENRGMDRSDMLQRVEEALCFMHLTDLADRSPHHLSGGQLQKVIMASALAVETPIIVLDEPTTFLDPLGAWQLFKLLKQLQAQGKTIVIAEQHLEGIAQFANRVIALHHGQKVLDGTARDVLTSPMLQKIGLGWNRFTHVADLAKSKGLWPVNTPLGTTLTDTVSGLMAGKK